MEGWRDGSSRWDSGEQDRGRERKRTRDRRRMGEENGAMASLLIGLRSSEEEKKLRR